MKNYVLRYTRDQYGRTAGSYVASGHPWSGSYRNVDLQGAYVFNTRMNRSGAMHRCTPEQLAERGLELIYVAVAPA